MVISGLKEIEQRIALYSGIDLTIRYPKQRNYTQKDMDDLSNFVFS